MSGPDQSIKSMPSVEGEDYTALVVRPGQALKVTLPNGRVLDFTPVVPKKAAPAPTGP